MVTETYVGRGRLISVIVMDITNGCIPPRVVYTYLVLKGIALSSRINS